MSTYDTFVYDRQGTGKGSVLFTPQRCGSSFTKKVLDNLPPEKRKGLHWLQSPEAIAKDPMLQPFGYTPPEDTRWWDWGLGFTELHLPPGVSTATVYRDPLVRYASGLSFLMTNWEQFLLEPMQQNLNYDLEEDKKFVEKLCAITGWNYTKYMENDKPETSPVYMHWKSTAVHMAKSFAKLHTTPDPIFDFTYNETHMDPIMLKSAIVSTMFEYSNFVLLEEYAEWLHNNVVSERYFDNLSTEDDLEHWKVGRLGLTDSSEMSPENKVYLKTLMREHYEVFENQHNFNHLNFEQWIEPEQKVYDFVFEHKGQFAQPDKKQMLLDFLIQLCGDCPHLFVRNKRLVAWVANHRVLERLPAPLQEAVKRNIGRGVRDLEDERPLKWSEWAKW